MTLNVQTQSLVVEGRERAEDALLADSMRHFIVEIKQIDATFWGKMPFVGQWQKDWEAAALNRFAEATTIRDTMGEFGTGLVQAAADYSNSDIKAALGLFTTTDQFGDKTGPEGDDVMRRFLQAMYGGKLSLGATPGGDIPDLKFYDSKKGMPDYRTFDPPAGDQSSLLARLAAIRTNTVTGYRPWKPTPGTEEVPRLFDTPGRKKLDEFKQNHYQLLNMAEKDVLSKGLAGEIGRMPTDFIDETGDAWPGMIINHAELFNVVVKNYEVMRGSMAANVDKLKSFWASQGGARAYYHAANTMLKYLDKTGKHAEWLAEEGKKAGRAVDNLLLGYADSGYEKIDIIIKKYKAYEDAKAKAIGGCDAEKILKSVAVALSALSSAYLSKLEATNAASQSEAKIHDRAADKFPDLNSGAHGPEKLPELELPGTNPGGDGRKDDDWWEGKGWKSGQPNPMVPIPTA